MHREYLEKWIPVIEQMHQDQPCTNFCSVIFSSSFLIVAHFGPTYLTHGIWKHPHSGRIMPKRSMSRNTARHQRHRSRSSFACLSIFRLCRLKKKAQGEVNATAISNLLPFMEYELHTQLMNKLKLRSMNALFGLHIQISIGENMLLGLAVGGRLF